MLARGHAVLANSQQQMRGSVVTTVQGAYSGSLPYLQNDTQTVILQMMWQGGKVIVEGRLWVHNMDSAAKIFRTWLTFGYPPQTIDYSEVGMPGHSAGWMTLYGWVLQALPANTPIEIRCATWNGEAGNSRMVGTVVDTFHLTTDSHVEGTDKVREPAK
jgi:hypothetical protein